MKKIKNICAVVGLMLALSLTAFADGEIHIPKTEPTPSQSVPMIFVSESGSGDITSPLVETALSILQSALSLF